MYSNRSTSTGYASIGAAAAYRACSVLGTSTGHSAPTVRGWAASRQQAAGSRQQQAAVLRGERRRDAARQHGNTAALTRVLVLQHAGTY